MNEVVVMNSENKKELSEFISCKFNTREFVLFCGAGISFNSGIPLANQLQSQILSEVFLRQIPKHCSWGSHPLGDNFAKSKKRIKDIMASSAPFEVIMEGALMNGNSDILEVFNSKSPNFNHLSIANLAKSGILKTIYTTNFDTLIEQAINPYTDMETNKQNKKYYMVLHKPEIIESYGCMEPNNKLTSIIKLHGCISDIIKPAIV